jgi:hypothetical protein
LGFLQTFASAVTKAKACKIEQESAYPCPCSKMGELCPIVLTDAFGCSQCQQIFVIRADGYVLEQISAIYPYRQHWYWTGQTWKLIRPPFFQNKFVWCVGVLAAVLVLLICFSLAPNIPFVPSLMVLVLLLLFMIFMGFIVSRRP